MSLKSTSILSSTGIAGNSSMGGGTQIKAARVRGIILNDKDHPEIFKGNNNWESIGSIFFEFVDSPSPNPTFEELKTAKSINPNQQILPLINELVYVMTVDASLATENSPSTPQFYYFTPINIWNSVHLNAIPDGVFGNSKPLSQNQNYEQTSAGSPNISDTKELEINLGKTFKALSNIKNLQPYEGDILNEGRWGQSIRFGSTVLGGEPKNTWSDVGTNGDPIMIMRNGQHDDGNDAWIPQIENINEDSSSIYLTSTQQIPIETINNEFTSYNTAPDKPNKYASSQVIINSNRLVFNAKTDSVLISGEKSVFLGGNGSLNFNAGKNVVIECGDIKLGDKEATEPIILGDKFLNDLNGLLLQIATLGNILGAFPVMVAPFTPSPAHIASATAMAERANNMIGKIESYKSKVSKTT
jgi:hypothetical protein